MPMATRTHTHPAHPGTGQAGTGIAATSGRVVEQVERATVKGEFYGKSISFGGVSSPRRKDNFRRSCKWRFEGGSMRIATKIGIGVSIVMLSVPTIAAAQDSVVSAEITENSVVSAYNKAYEELSRAQEELEIRDILQKEALEDFSRSMGYYFANTESQFLSNSFLLAAWDSGRASENYEEAFRIYNEAYLVFEEAFKRYKESLN